MFNETAEKIIAKYLSVGSFTITVFLVSSMNTDPVNVTKLFVLGGVAFSLMLITFRFQARYLVNNFKRFILIVALLQATMLSSTLLSEAPLVQNIYGAYGRNTGFFTYFFLSIIMVAALSLRNRKYFEWSIRALLAAGVLNIAYCSWVLAFGDFIGWENRYSKILGLFGNPDFISAFLGMFITASFAYIVNSQTSWKIRCLLLALSSLALFEILKSHAIQGLVVSAGGLAIVGFYFLRDKFKSVLIPSVYLSLGGALGVLAVLGTLQRGPFSFVYKRSVSLRGTYWHAGIEMGKTNPFSGVGLDSYGDWYRRTRPPVALLDMPGVNTTSNVAHNVVVDFFASGGYPLLFSYLAILLLGLAAIFRFTIRNKKYDPVFVALAGTWLAYQAQSIISINQVGLAVWGWLFTGLLVAYERISRSDLNNVASATLQAKIKKRVNQSVISPQLVGGVGLVIGLFIASPPFTSDAKWFSATGSRSAEVVEAALAPSYINPPDTYKYLQAVNLFQNSNLPELAHKYAAKAVEFNPDSFDAWKQFYFLPNSTEAEKTLCLENMKRLDPLNPDVLSQ